MTSLWKLKPVLVSLCVILAFSGPAFSSEAVLQGFFDQLRQRGFSATLSGVAQEGDALSVAEIVIRNDSDDAGSITIKDLSAAKLAAAKGGGLEGDLLSIGKLEVSFGAVSAHFPDIAITEFSFPQMDLLFPAVAVKDAKETAPPKRDLAAFLLGDIHVFLAEISLKAMNVSPATLVFSNGTAKTTVRTGALSLAAITDHVLGHLALGSVEIEQTGSSSGDFRMVTGAFSVSEYDFSENARAILPAHYKDGIGDSEWRTISGPLSFENLVFTSADGTTRLAKALITETRVRQLTRPPRAILESIRALDDKALAENGDAVEPHAFQRAMAIFRPMSEYVGAALEGLEITPPDAASTRVETIAVDRFSSIEGIGSIIASNVDIRPSTDKGSATLGRLAISDVRFPEFAELAQSTDEPAANPALLALFDPAAAPASTLGGLTAENIVVNREIGSFSIDQVAVTLRDYVKLIPTVVDFTFDTLSVPLGTWSGPNNIIDLLKALGYDTLVMNGTSKMHWDPATSTLHLDETTVSADEIGDSHLEGAITGISRGMLEQPQAAAADIDKLKLATLRLSVTDKSFINRFATYIASQTGTSPDEVKAQYGVLASAPLDLLQNPEFQAKARAEIAKFLADPKSLTLSMEPKEPQSLIGIFLMLQQLPSELVKALNFDIKAE